MIQLAGIGAFLALCAALAVRQLAKLDREDT